MSVGLYLHALRSARGRQLAGRARAVVSRRRFPRSSPAARFSPPEGLEALWRSPAFAAADEAVAGDGIRVLGLELPFPPPDWSLPGQPRLRRFHLHYGEEVLGLARCGDEAAAAKALRAWIDGNPPRRSDAWHPYVVSTRAANWIRALALMPSLAEQRVVGSLRFQLAYLTRNVEDGVLGNHVIRNANALILGGVAFGDEALRRRGEEVLRREVPEQVLPDGGHYERSPVYHLIVLRDLAEAREAGSLEWLEPPLARMRAFASALARPDGQPAPFNDAPLDLAPALDLPKPPDGLAVFPETGYAVVRDGDLWLAFDCGPPAPPFLPAHAHADALSIQLWRGGEPVVADPGTSTYEPGSGRSHDRSTRAHSTVCVDGRDQFETWKSFRAGPLPDVRLEHAGEGVLAATVEYAGVRHERAVTWDDRRVTIQDQVAAPRGSLVESRLLLAPGTRAEPVPAGSADGVREEPASVAERLFAPVPARSVVITCPAGAGAQLGWTLDLRA